MTRQEGPPRSVGPGSQSEIGPKRKKYVHRDGTAKVIILYCIVPRFLLPLSSCVPVSPNFWG